MDVDVLVIGAGPAGLATAAMLKRRGLSVRVLERGNGVGTAWRERYDGLRLNTVRWLSSQPGLRLSRNLGRWVERDDFVSYLERYADQHDLEVETSVTVDRLDRMGDVWVVSTSLGNREARYLVVAGGLYNTPRKPDWPGVGGYHGHLLHAADFKSASEFSDKDVLVVGAGNTGTEVAQQLAGAGVARIRISVRTPPNIVPREILRFPSHPLSLLARGAPPVILDRSTRIVTRLKYGDLARVGLPTPSAGVHTTSLRGRPPVIDAGFVQLVKRGIVEVVAPVKAFSDNKVILSDGSHIEPNAVIAAVGYEAGLERIVSHLGVLDDAGRPLACTPRTHPDAPGLYFVGYQPKLGGLLVDIGPEARRTARAVVRSSLGATTRAA